MQKDKTIIKLGSLAQNISSDYVSAMSVLSNRDTIVVYVEGWDDVSFWRSILDDFETESVKFEIMPPLRPDLAKGKKVVLNFGENAGRNLWLAVDSDFDWIFDGMTYDSRRMKSCKWLIQTYAYAIENLQCAPESLSSVLSRITKVDRHVFDFEEFFRNYSKTIFPLFVWYVWSASINDSAIFPLGRFANAVRINKLSINDNGVSTLRGLSKFVAKIYAQLCMENADRIDEVSEFEQFLKNRGITPETTHYYMQGHALKDNVVKNMLEELSTEIINRQIVNIQSAQVSPNLKDNQICYYKNSTRPVDQVLSENLGFKRTRFYSMITENISRVMQNRSAESQ